MTAPPAQRANGPRTVTCFSHSFRVQKIPRDDGPSAPLMCGREWKKQAGAPLAEPVDNIVPLGPRGRSPRRWRREAAPPERDGAPPSPTLRAAYARRQARLRAFFLRRTGSPEAAEDLVQELWLRIAKDADETGFENPDSWLQRVAINLALNWLRQNRFQAQYIAHADDGADAVDDAPGPDRQAQARQGLDFLRDLLDELSPRRRRAFLLYRGEGLSLNETAQQMGVSSSTAKKQIAAAVAFLRERMGEAGLWP